jgi:hypothetical protein
MLNRYNEPEFSETDLDDIGFGISIIPLSTINLPYTDWSEYKTKVAPVKGWYNHYKNQGNIGVITGNVSGGLDCLLIYKVSVADSFLKIIPGDLQAKLVMIKTPCDGLYILYRCSTIEPCQILSEDSTGSAIISTIGDGYFIPLNRYQYPIIQGKEHFDLTNLVANVPVIKEYDRDILLQRARILNHYRM